MRGAAARAAHDYLFTYRGGKVQATLNILSVDMVSRTIVLLHNSHCPIFIITGEGLRVLDEPSVAGGGAPRYQAAGRRVAPYKPRLLSSYSPLACWRPASGGGSR